LVKPGNRRRWKIATAAKARAAYKQRISDARRRKNGGGNGSVAMTTIADQTEGAFERYHAAEAAMRALPTLAARRKAAHELVLIAREALRLMHARDVDCDLHPEHVELKNQAIALLVVRGLEGPCGWSHSQAWDCFNADDGEDSEAA